MMPITKKWSKQQWEMYKMGQRDCYRHVQRLIDREMLKGSVKLGFWRTLKYLILGPNYAIFQNNLDLHHSLMETIDYSIDHLDNNLP